MSSTGFPVDTDKLRIPASVGTQDSVVDDMSSIERGPLDVSSVGDNSSVGGYSSLR